VLFGLIQVFARVDRDPVEQHRVVKMGARALPGISDEPDNVALAKDLAFADDAFEEMAVEG